MKTLKYLPLEIPREDFLKKLFQDVILGKVRSQDVAPHFRDPITGQIQASAYLAFMHLLKFQRSGSPIFTIPLDIQKGLSKIDATSLSVRDVQLPNLSAYVALPESPHQLWGGPETGWHQVSGAFISVGKSYQYLDSDGSFRESDSPRVIMDLFIWAQENERSRAVGDDACFWVSLDLQEIREKNENLEEHLRWVFFHSESEKHVKIDFPTEVRSAVSKSAFQVSKLLMNFLALIGTDLVSEAFRESEKRLVDRLSDLKDEVVRKKNVRKQRKATNNYLKISSENYITVALREGVLLPTEDSIWIPDKFMIREALRRKKESLEEDKALLSKIQKETSSKKKMALQEVITEGEAEVESLSLELGKSLSWTTKTSDP